MAPARTRGRGSGREGQAPGADALPAARVGPRARAGRREGALHLGHSAGLGFRFLRGAVRGRGRGSGRGVRRNRGALGLGPRGRAAVPRNPIRHRHRVGTAGRPVPVPARAPGAALGPPSFRPAAGPGGRGRAQARGHGHAGGGAAPEGSRRGSPRRRGAATNWVALPVEPRTCWMVPANGRAGWRGSGSWPMRRSCCFPARGSARPSWTACWGRGCPAARWAANSAAPGAEEPSS